MGGRGASSGLQLKENTKEQSHAQFLRNELGKTLRPQFGKHKNIETGIEANLNGRSLKKLGSDKAIEKSKENGFSISEHFEVANQIKDLYIKSKLFETTADKKGSRNILSIKRFRKSLTLSTGRKTTAHITVKESLQNGHTIYSVELLELK